MDDQVDMWEYDLARPGLYEGPNRTELEEKLGKLKNLRIKRRAEYQELTGHAPPPPVPPTPPVAPAVPPVAPPVDGTTISLESDGGTGLNVLYGNRPFNVVVKVPRTGTPPEPTITVKFHAPGGDRTLKLAWDQGEKGAVRYKSEPITLDAGAEGGGKLSFEMPVHMPGRPASVGEIRTGGMSGISLSNGDPVIVSVGEGAQQVSVGVPAYQTVRDHALQVNQQFLSGMHDYVVRGLIALKSYGDLPAAVETRAILNQKLELLEHARIVMGHSRNDGPIEQLAWGNGYVRLLREPGLIDIHVEEGMVVAGAQDLIHRQYTEIMDGFVKDFGIGFYQFTMSQIPLVGSVWTAVTGTDIMGHKVEGWERVVAVLDSAGQAAMMGLPVAMQHEYAVPGTTARIQSRGTSEAPPVKDILQAPGGTRVGQVEDFGLDRAQVKEFRAVLEKHAGKLAEQTGAPEQKIYAGVRATGKEALGQASEGFSGKPEPIKSKTADVNDKAGGWSPETGPATYVTPEQVAGKLGVTPEQVITKVMDATAPGGYKWVPGAKPEGVTPAVWKRAGQRIAEYHDEAGMMTELIDRGLARVDAQGRIIDTGVSNYTLDPNTHELVKTFKGPEGGTGKPIYGDPDLYGFWLQDGTMLTDAQIAPILVDLGPRFRMTDQGLVIEGVRVMHPDIYSWHPEGQKNIDIRNKIMNKHMGGAVIDSDTGAAIGVGPVNIDGEGLIIIGGRSDPAVVGWGGAPMVKAIEPMPAGAGAPAAGRRFPARLVPIGVGGLLLFGSVIGAAGLRLGPFAPAGTHTSQAGQPGQPAPAAVVKPYGLGLEGASAELKFAGFVAGTCPAGNLKFMSPMFSGGWKIGDTSAAAPTDQSVSMVGLPTSPFAVAMNGKIGPTGALDVNGDSSIEFVHLMLAVPPIPPGKLQMPLNVTGSADVRLHFIGNPAIGTVTGDCGGTYQATGTIAPP
jgi:hypothetical protein